MKRINRIKKKRATRAQLQEQLNKLATENFVLRTKQAPDKTVDKLLNSLDRRKSHRRKIENLLQEAERIIYGPRDRDYGHPIVNHKNIQRLWQAYFDAKPAKVFSIFDVSILNILQKIGRLATNPRHYDSIMDIAGYAGCIDKIMKRESEIYGKDAGAQQAGEPIQRNR